MRISDWSSDVCSSDLEVEQQAGDDTVGNGHLVAAPAQPAAGHLQPKVDAGGTLGRRRSEERRVGNECVRTCRPRWSPDHKKNKNTKTRDNTHVLAIL